MVRTHNRGGAHAGKPTPSRVGTSVRGTRARGARARVGEAGNKKRTGESRVGGVHLRSARVRVIAAAGATVLLLAGLAFGWVTPQPGAEPTVQAFLLDWENGQYAAAAALTTGAAVQVADALQDSYADVGAAAVSLGIAAVNPNGALIRDANGNNADFSKAAVQLDATSILGDAVNETTLVSASASQTPEILA